VFIFFLKLVELWSLDQMHTQAHFFFLVLLV
jgi:hypothetical protein